MDEEQTKQVRDLIRKLLEASPSKVFAFSAGFVAFGIGLALILRYRKGQPIDVGAELFTFALETAVVFAFLWFTQKLYRGRL